MRWLRGVRCVPNQGSTGVVKNLRLCTHDTGTNPSARTEEVLENLSVRRFGTQSTSQSHHADWFPVVPHYNLYIW
jgi:hypothetical protein